MPAITEQNNLGDPLKYEAPNRYSRDVATIAAGQNQPSGNFAALLALTALHPVGQAFITDLKPRNRNW